MAPVAAAVLEMAVLLAVQLAVAAEVALIKLVQLVPMVLVAAVAEEEILLLLVEPVAKAALVVSLLDYTENKRY